MNKITETKNTRKTEPKGTNLTDEEQAILNAASQKPLWMQDDRLSYEKKQMFDVFQKEDEINFELFDKDYLSVFEVFS